MIAHQEQISLNQQQKQLLQQQQQQQQKQRTSLLSNLILAQPKHATSTITIAQNSTKRTRIDPDTRAALIQRVPKAVKRTALIANPPKLQKAVKHTGPRPQPATSNVLIINDIAPSPNLVNRSPNTTPSSTIKVQKAVKHTSAASMLLKELLPPPIMQSTKRPTVNKAVKHTGGGTNAYYQAGKMASPQLNKITLVNSSAAPHHPLSQLSLNSNNGDLKNASGKNSSPSNKITITTTYVYKRVMSQPEIDLDLECEEEEIVYVVKEPEPEPEPEPIEVESSEPILQVEEAQVEQSEAKIEEVDVSKEPEVEQEQKGVEDTSEKIDLVDKKADKVEKLERAEKQQTSKAKVEDGSETSDKKVASKKEKSNKKEEPTEAAQSSAGSYSNILAKFYARRPGALSAALKTSSSSSSSSNKKFKSASSTLPPDLRNGNYPAKVMFYSGLKIKEEDSATHIF
jgi:hypothetical protein